MSWLLFAQLIVFGLSLWVGLYLLANDVGRRRLVHSGVALLLVATAVAVSALLAGSNGVAWAAALVTLSASFWTGGMVALLVEEAQGRNRLLRVWGFLLLPLAALLALFSALSPYPALAHWLVIVGVIVPLIPHALCGPARAARAAAESAALAAGDCLRHVCAESVWRLPAQR
ncbi:MAG: hypothetical protein HC802_12585 [Caldilineaceae bacterium]|nr:hypothetical protein [Caldilineaceae bacterium]